MNKKILYAAWAALYVITVILGSVEPSGALAKGIRIALAVCFFIPPAVLMYFALKNKDRKTVRLLRLLSAVSLGATFVLMVVNFLSVGMSQNAGDMLYALLIVASAPMMCSQYWAVSMFAWACILMTGILYCPKEK